MYYKRGLIKFAYVVWIYLAMVASHWRGWEPGSSSAHGARRPRRVPGKSLVFSSHWKAKQDEWVLMQRKPMTAAAGAVGQTPVPARSKSKASRLLFWRPLSLWPPLEGDTHSEEGSSHHPPSTSVNPSWTYLPRSTQWCVLWLNPDLIKTTIEISHQNYNYRIFARFSLKNGISSQNCHQLNKTWVVTMPVCMSMWIGNMSQGSTPKWRVTVHQWLLQENQFSLNTRSLIGCPIPSGQP